MGTSVNQIATETNVETNYASYIDVSAVSNKCITVKRLLKGLLSTNNKPIYKTSGGAYNTAYKVKAIGSTSITGIRLSDSDNLTGITSKIIQSTASDYGGYPFSSGTGFLAINAVTTITATITITYAKKTIYNPLSDDGVSPASMDFDNPEEDTESNTNGQEPSLTGNMGRAVIAGCNNAGAGDTGCTCNTGLTANITPGPGSCLTDLCTPISTTTSGVAITRACVAGIKLQIYNGVDSDGNDNYINITSTSVSRTVTLNTGISSTVTLSIPTGTVFTITGTPNGVFRFNVSLDAMGFNSADPNGALSISVTATMPAINLVVYNPSPKCIKYQDLRYVYGLYGKSV